MKAAGPAIAMLNPLEEMRNMRMRLRRPRKGRNRNKKAWLKRRGDITNGKW